MNTITEMRSTDGSTWTIVRKSENHGSVTKTVSYRDKLGTETLVPAGAATSYIKNDGTVVLYGETLPADVVDAIVAR